MGKRRQLTVKEQTEQLRIIEEKAVRAAKRRLRLRLAKLHLEGRLQKAPTLTPKATESKGQREEELKQIEEFVQAGNVEKLMPR